ncbi:uncharacterized protein LOC122668898 [Telopea speciosissima]|uniref:uncharacterized protein LOC122668898 n=1 Tax=Telopea speciosissima TaxID=54955 RepID=UPI001CC3A957|nr:uncharacterized protein LOC122668898 [Telopea speciosissima]
MSIVAISLFKPLSMAEGCLTSFPTLFTPKTSYPFLSLPSKPTKLHLSSSPFSHPSWFSLTNKFSPATLVPLVAQTTSGLTEQEAGKTDEQTKKYFFVVANAKFMLDEEEHFKELLFERLRYYGERNKEQDFWLVIEPKFLDKFPNISKRLKRPAVALVSTNGPWITFMKLRLDRVLTESYEADSLEEALASTPANLEFEKPENWVAPYPKYEFGWWEPFLPPGSNKTKV